ncbi:MAG: hypothetical protein WC942_08085, partial [Clostridia bacterium]
ENHMCSKKVMRIVGVKLTLFEWKSNVRSLTLYPLKNGHYFKNAFHFHIAMKRLDSNQLKPISIFIQPILKIKNK